MTGAFTNLRHCLSFGLLLMLAGPVLAQDLSLEEPRWLRLRGLPEASVGAEIEGLREDVDLRGSTTTHEYLSLTPLLGLRTQGSIYHPNLLSFDLSGEGGVGWLTDTVKSPGFDVTRHETSNLLRYLATVNFLQSKPYNASFFASQDHDYQNYDFFNTATVDSTRYGGRASWTTSKLNLSADTGYRNEKANGTTGISEFSDTYLALRGVHQRDRGNTTATFNYDNYDNQVNLGPVQNSVSYAAAVSDSETFGSRDQITATTGFGYNQYEYFNQASDTFNASENITINHLPTLDSFYYLNYDRTEQEPATYQFFQGTAGIRHHLYSSLTSTLDSHGAWNEGNSPTSNSSNDRYGLGLREDYVKHIGSWGRLSIGGGLIADHEDHFNSGGNTFLTINEPHTLHQGIPVSLNNPNVIASSIQVLGPGGVTATRGIDYEVIQSGQLTQILLLLGSSGSVLHDGDNVLVTYLSDSLYTASYETLNGSAQIRLDIVNIFGVYGRLNWIDNNAPQSADTLVQTLLDLVGGADATWRWLRAGVEYEDFDSNFAKYKAWRLFQNFTFQVAEGAHLGIDFNQIFYKYPDSRDETQYQFISHLDTQLTSWLTWNVEGGLYYQDFFGTKQTLGAARTGLNLLWGKLRIKAGYQYNYQKTEQTMATEDRFRHFFFVHLRRTF